MESWKLKLKSRHSQLKPDSSSWEDWERSQKENKQNVNKTMAGEKKIEKVETLEYFKPIKTFGTAWVSESYRRFTVQNSTI